MFLKKNIALFAKSSFLASLITLTACQSTNSLQPQTSVQSEQDSFYLQGKIGIRTPEQSGSAFYEWLQQQDEYEIEISGILGIGKTQIIGNATQVSLTNAQVGTIYANSPEQLLQQATGWSAPISYLKYWVNAKAATAEAKISFDAQQRPSQIDEATWTVKFDYDEQQKQPKRLTLTQTLDNAKQNQIIITIQNRQ